MLKKREKHTGKEGKDGWRISTEKRNPFEKVSNRNSRTETHNA